MWMICLSTHKTKQNLQIDNLKKIPFLIKTINKLKCSANWLVIAEMQFLTKHISYNCLHIFVEYTILNLSISTFYFSLNEFE